MLTESIAWKSVIKVMSRHTKYSSELEGKDREGTGTTHLVKKLEEVITDGVMGMERDVLTHKIARDVRGKKQRIKPR